MVGWMRWHGPLALALLVGGIVLLALAFSEGGAQVHLLLIIPVITGTTPLAFLGVLLVLAAMVLVFAALAGRTVSMEDLTESAPASAPGAPKTASPTRSLGGVLFLGPFPIVFGNNARIARTSLLLGIALFALLVAFYAAVLLGWLRLG